MFKRLTAVLVLAAVLYSIFCVPVYAETEKPQYSYVLMEGKTATLLYSENGSAVVPAHHSAKLMTLLLVCEAIDRGELGADTVLKTSSRANSMQGAQIWLMPGEEITVDELLAAITIGSANDACVVLAEAVGGTEEGFVAMMNEKAEELGMADTKYADSTGVSRDSVTTACDTAILASELSNYEFLAEYMTTWIKNVRGGQTQLVNENRLVLTYPGLTGMKAYYAKDIANCLVASAERDGLRMICVIFGEPDEFRRFTTAKEKMNIGFNAYSLYLPKRTDIFTEPAKILKGEKTEVETELAELKPFVIRNGTEESIECTVEYFDNVEAPLDIGDSVGRAVYSIDGKEIYSCAIVAVEPVRRIGFFIALKRSIIGILMM